MDTESGLVPQEITDHTGQAQESVLIGQLISGAEDDEASFNADDIGDGDAVARLGRLYRARHFIREFVDKVSGLLAEEPDKGDLKEIKDALALMLKLHINQSDRIDGSGPYITHPLKVAIGILETYKGQHLVDTVIAALLHDAVEDQATLVKLLHVEHDGDMTRDLEISHATHALSEKFSPDVAELVRILSNTQEEERRILRKDAYFNLVKSIVDNTDNHGPEAFAIKWQDARENMLKVGELWRHAEYLLKVAASVSVSRKGELEEQAVRAGEYYIGLRAKYEPVLRDIFLPAFTNMDREHILYNIRDQSIKEIDKALKTEFNLDQQNDN